jgi:hypothetical protein
MSGSDETKALARTYLESWQARDFDRLRSVLADDVTFHGVLGVAAGADECIAGLRGMAENVMTDLDIQVMVADGPDVLTWFDLHTATTEPLPTVNWSHVENGRIARIRVTFDPRPLFAAQDTS